MGGRFPALAVFGLPALSVALALFVLWGLRPWENNSDAPHEVPLGIETAVGGAKALSAGSTADVGAGVAAPAGPSLQPAQRVSSSTGSNPSLVPHSDSSSARIVVAPAQAIVVAEGPSSPAGSAPESGPGAEVPSVGATAVEAPTEGASTPAATPAGTGGGSQEPVTAGAKPPEPKSCEGDEYEITITFLDEEATVEEAPAEILLAQINEDGSTDELQLEGNLSDARALASTLEAEGNCVTVEIAQREDEGAEGEAEEPRASEEAPESGEEVTDSAESPVPASP